jgi:hypothetical protein
MGYGVTLLHETPREKLDADDWVLVGMGWVLPPRNKREKIIGLWVGARVHVGDITGFFRDH